MPRNTFVLISAKKSNAFEIFVEKICVIIIIDITNNINNITEKTPIAEVMMKNQSENPNVTANALNRGEDNSI